MRSSNLQTPWRSGTNPTKKNVVLAFFAAAILFLLYIAAGGNGKVQSNGAADAVALPGAGFDSNAALRSPSSATHASNGAGAGGATSSSSSSSSTTMSDSSSGSDSAIARITETTSVPFDIVTRAISDGVSDLMRASHGYAPVESAIVDSLLRVACSTPNPPLVLDVGANIGYFTLLAAAHGCRVRAYEPNTRLCARLQASLLLNGFASRVTIVNAGVGATKGRLRYHQDAANPARTGIMPDEPAYAHLPAIPIVTLADELTEDVVFLKMDTEGFEPNALQGLLPACSKYTISNIIIEIKKPTQKDTLQKLWACLDASAKHAGLTPPNRGMWFREWYSAAEVADFHSLDNKVTGKMSYGYETPHGYVERMQSPWDFNNEDVWYSLQNKGWDSIATGAA